MAHPAGEAAPVGRQVCALRRSWVDLEHRTLTVRPESDFTAKSGSIVRLHEDAYLKAVREALEEESCARAGVCGMCGA